MKNYESPINFNTNMNIGNYYISYSNLKEICQGGPEIGNISINDKLIDLYFFGGPFLFKEDCIFIPVYFKKFFNTGFKIGKLNLMTFQIEFVGKTKDLIYLDKIEENLIYFFEDLNKQIISSYTLK